VPDDAAELSIIHVRAWQEGYRGIMPAAYLDALAPDVRRRMWDERLATAAPDEESLVAGIDGSKTLTGFTALGSARQADEVGLGELQSLNVHPDAWGQGVGAALVEAAAAWLWERGFDAAVLWVVRENERARRLYEAHGWHPDGADTTITIGEADVVEVRYRIAR
jgi:GNAT superfamily N-acetyltransferase